MKFDITQPENVTRGELLGIVFTLAWNELGYPPRWICAIYEGENGVKVRHQFVFN